MAIVVIVVVVVVVAVMVAVVVVAFSLRTRHQHTTRHENSDVPSSLSETVNRGCGSTVCERVLDRDTTPVPV